MIDFIVKISHFLFLKIEIQKSLRTFFIHINVLVYFNEQILLYTKFYLLSIPY